MNEELCGACKHNMSDHDSAGCVICDAQWTENPGKSKRCAVVMKSSNEAISS